MVQIYLAAIQDYDPSLPIPTFGEKFVFGGQILLIGMLTVFAVLCVLWAFMIAFKFFFHDLAAKRTAAPKIIEETVVQEVVYETDDGEIIAAIAAAIAMAESESPTTKFRVVSFRRK